MFNKILRKLPSHHGEISVMEIKDADQLHGYCAADQCAFGCHIYKNRFSHDTAQMLQKKTLLKTFQNQFLFTIYIFFF